MIIKNLIFGIAIFILTIFVGIYGINTFYGKSPEYNDYCPTYLDNSTACAEVGGTWNSGAVSIDGKQIPAENRGYCSYDYTTCQNKLEEAEEDYWRGVFLIALPLGIIILVIGYLVLGLEFVGAGLMAGGVGILVYGAGAYWRFAQDWLKFTLSIIGLIILISVAYLWNRKRG